MSAAMLSRVAAAWLVALIILPFSAPFSTCDAASLFGDLADDASAVIESVSSSVDAGASHALPVRTARDMKLAAAPVGISTPVARRQRQPQVDSAAHAHQPPDAGRRLPLRI